MLYNTRFNLTLRTSRKCRLSECYTDSSLSRKFLNKEGDSMESTSEHIEQIITVLKTETKPVRQRIKKLIEFLNTGLYEKDEAIRLALLSAAAGESIFFLGPPGNCKEYD